MFQSAAGLMMGIAGLALAAKVSIPYTGGKQSGLLTFGGENLDPAFADTVVLDEGLAVSIYTARPKHDTGIVVDYCVVPVHNGINLRATSGIVGFASQNTTWTQATSFPGTLDTLPFVPAPGFASSIPLGPDARGHLVGIQEEAGYCSPKGFFASNGYDRLIYFRLSKTGGFRYGKLMVTELKQVPSPYYGPRLRTIFVAYALTGSQDIDVGPVSLMPGSATVQGPRRRLVWDEKRGILIRDERGSLYDLRGNRSP